MAYDIELAPKVTDDSGLLDLEKQIKEIEEKGINLQLKLPKLNDNDNKQLLAQIKTINKFAEELRNLTGDSTVIEKTIKLNVNVDNVSRQIVQGLKVLDKLNPDDSRFSKLLRDYTGLEKKYSEFFDSDISFNDIKAITEYFDNLKKAANQVYTQIKKIESELSKDKTLMDRLGEGYDILSSKDFSSDAIKEIKDTYNREISRLKAKAQREIDSLQSKIESAQNQISKNKGLISGREDEEGPFVRSIKKEIASSEQAIEEYRAKIEEAQKLQQQYDQYVSDFSYTPQNIGTQQVDTGVEQVATATSKSLEGVSRAAKELDQTLNGVSSDETVQELQEVTQGAQQASSAIEKKFSEALETNLKFLTTFVEELNKTLLTVNAKMSTMGKTWFDPMKTSMENAEKAIQAMKETTKEIKLPFDEASITNVAKQMDSIFQQFSQFDGSEKLIKLKVEVTNEELLKKAAQYAKVISDAAKVSSDYAKGKKNQEQTQTQVPTQTSGVAKKKKKKSDDEDDPDVIKATNKAVEAYEKLVPKEVKITLKVENFDDLQTAIGYIKEIDARNKHIAPDTVTSVNPKIQSGVFKPSNDQGNTTPNNGSGSNGGNSKPTNPDVLAKLQAILTGVNKTPEKLKEISGKLDIISKQIPSSEALISVANKLSEQPQTTSKPDESKAPTGDNGERQGNSNDVLRAIGDSVKHSTNLMSEAVDEFHSYCQRFLRRFPIPQNNTGASTINPESSNNNDNNSNNGNNKPTDPNLSTNLQSLSSGVNNVFEKLKEVVTKLESIRKKIPTAQSIASAKVAAEEKPQVAGTKEDSVTTTQSKTPDNDGGENQDNSILLNINTSIDKVAQKGEDIITKLTAIQKKIPTAKSLTNSKTETKSESAGNDNDGSGNQSLISTLIDPKLSAIQTSVANIDNNLSNGEISKKGSGNNKSPSVSSEVKNIDKNVNSILAALKSTGNKNTDKSKKSETGKKAESKTKSKDHTSEIKGKLDNLPTRLNNIQQTNSTISKNTKNIQTNTGNTSSKVAQVRDTIKSKADTISAQLTALKNSEPKTEAPDNSNDPTAKNFATLETAIQNLTTAIQSPNARSDAQNAQNRNSAPDVAQAAQNLSQVSDIKVWTSQRLNDFQKILGFFGDKQMSDVFGGRHQIEAYIETLKQLNNEIVAAGKILNRSDVSASARAAAQDTLNRNNRIMLSMYHGDAELGINPEQIKQLNSLLYSINMIDEKLGQADSSIENLKRLQDSLKAYDVNIEPINAALTSLKEMRASLTAASNDLRNASLEDATRVENQLVSSWSRYEELINQANGMLDTEQENSLRSISQKFLEAEKDIDKYKSKIDSLKNLLQDLKKNNVALSSFDIGNGKTAKDLQDFITNYERMLDTRKSIANAGDMQNFATNFRTNYQAPLQQFVDGLGDARRRLNEITTAASKTIQSNNFNKQLADFTTSVEKWKKANSSAFSNKDFKNTYEKIFNELTSGTVQSTERLSALRAEFANLKLRVNQASLATKSFTVKLKEMFKKYGGWTLVTRTLNTAMRLVRSMVTQVKELDTSMTNLKKVTQATGNQLNAFLESAGERSVNLGASLTDYVDAVSEFSRLGKSLDEAQKLGELATTYKSVAEDLDIKTASKSIISTMQAFNSVGVQADEIVDKFNYVGKMLPLITISVKVQRWIRPR